MPLNNMVSPCSIRDAETVDHQPEPWCPSLTHEHGTIKLQALTVDDVEAALTRRTIPADEQLTPRKGRGRAAASALSRNSLIKLRSTLSQALTWAQLHNMLRHSAASLMSDAGIPLERIADQHGHKDTRMLANHYRHQVRPTIDDALILDGILGSPDD